MANCFGPNDAVRLGWRVLRQAPPPSANGQARDSYRFYPLTDACSQQNMTASTWTGGGINHFIWVNRYNHGAGNANRRPNNIYPDIFRTISGSQVECRMEYTTLAKAIAATKCQIAWSCGQTLSAVTAIATAAGFSSGDVQAHSVFAAAPDTYFTSDPFDTNYLGQYKVAVDKIYLLTWRIVDASSAARKGIFLDYEPGDDRDTTSTSDFLSWVKTTATAASVSEVILYTNGLNVNGVGVGNTGNGLTPANVPTIASSYVDLFGFVCDTSGVVATTMVGDYLESIECFKGVGGLGTPAYSKIAPIFSLAVSYSEMKGLIEQMQTDGVNKLITWDAGSDPGGSCSNTFNRKLALIAQGRPPRCAAVLTGL